MARERNWDALGERQRRRYIGAGRREGLSEDQVREHYLSGGSLTRWRGKKERPGITSSQFDRLVRLGKDARWTSAREGLPLKEVLEDLIARGFAYEWIAERLREKKESRDYYSTLSKRERRDSNVYKGPGTDRFSRRTPYANVELYYYH